MQAQPSIWQAEDWVFNFLILNDVGFYDLLQIHLFRRGTLDVQPNRKKTILGYFNS